MIEALDRAEYDALLRQDFATFAARCFYDLNPQTELAPNWHIDVIAATRPGVETVLNRPLGNDLHLRELMAEVAAHYLKRALVEAQG